MQSAAREYDSAELGAGAAAPAPAGAGDAPPTNRASQSYRKGGGDQTRILRTGIDSLYLSFQGDLGASAEVDLAQLKLAAQSKRKSDQAVAQYPINNHLFEVKPGGQRMYPYILEDGAFRIALSSGGSRKIPFAYVKVSSDVLAHSNVNTILRDLTDVLAELSAEFELFPTVSRVDLFADFQTTEDLGAITTEAWVTRASSAVAYYYQGELSGWTIGEGASMSARLYNKTLEIKQRSHKTYLFGLWRRAGYVDGSRVWRLEFQLTREVLDQLGIHSVASLLDNQGGIWAYATQSWLRLATPHTGDKNRARWPRIGYGRQFRPSAGDWTMSR